MVEYKVKSLPLKEVVADLAGEFNTTYKEECGLYILNIPPYIGRGTIKGINFSNGLGILIYDCFFNEDIRIKFTVDQVHPMKYLYCLEGSVIHKFGESDDEHLIGKYRNVVVASPNNIGHILEFKKRTRTRIKSLEINRENFADEMTCEINQLNSEIKSALVDVTAKETFYYSGDYSLRTAKTFEEIQNFPYDDFLRKAFLHSKAWEILVYQTIQFNKSKTEKREKDAIEKEVELVRKAVLKIDGDLAYYKTIGILANELGIESKKLQSLFRKYNKTTINDYMMQKRIEVIVDLLENTDNSIGDICEITGIKSKSYLSKIFKDHYGLSPSEFRES